MRANLLFITRTVVLASLGRWPAVSSWPVLLPTPNSVSEIDSEASLCGRSMCWLFRTRLDLDNLAGCMQIKESGKQCKFNVQLNAGRFIIYYTYHCTVLSCKFIVRFDTVSIQILWNRSPMDAIFNRKYLIIWWLIFGRCHNRFLRNNFFHHCISWRLCIAVIGMVNRIFWYGMYLSFHINPLWWFLILIMMMIIKIITFQLRFESPELALLSIIHTSDDEPAHNSFSSFGWTMLWNDSIFILMLLFCRWYEWLV